MDNNFNVLAQKLDYKTLRIDFLKHAILQLVSTSIFSIFLIIEIINSDLKSVLLLVFPNLFLLSIFYYYCLNYKKLSKILSMQDKDVLLKDEKFIYFKSKGETKKVDISTISGIYVFNDIKIFIEVDTFEYIYPEFYGFLLTKESVSNIKVFAMDNNIFLSPIALFEIKKKVKRHRNNQSKID